LLHLEAESDKLRDLRRMATTICNESSSFMEGRWIGPNRKEYSASLLTAGNFTKQAAELGAYLWTSVSRDDLCWVSIPKPVRAFSALGFLGSTFTRMGLRHSILDGRKKISLSFLR
jgi:hypothetical protein